jgi:uncharacterized caspase-like protein
MKSGKIGASPARAATRTAALLTLLAIAAFLASCQLATVPTTPANRYALVIGVQDYAFIDDLEYPDNDANDMADLLSSQGWTIKQTLINSAATYATIEADIADLSSDPNATILVYYSGHGTSLDGIAYMLPYDTTTTYISGSLSSLAKAVSATTLTTWMAAVPAKNRILILDSCYSGGFVTSDAAVDISPASYGYYEDGTTDVSLFTAALSKFNTLLASNISNYGKPEIQVLSAAGSDEYSYDGTVQMANGAFTYYLLQAGEKDNSSGHAKGDADSDGCVTVDEAYIYAKDQIKINWDAEYTTNMNYWKTYYNYYGYVPDFLPHISGGTKDLVLYAGY